MAPIREPQEIGTDSAAVFGAAMSLWQACHKHAADDGTLNLSAAFNGIDSFMREVMRIGELFETWACEHVAFEESDDVWPYLLMDKFGDACLAQLQPGALAQFDDSDCLRVAIQLRLPIKLDDSLPLPFDLQATNPVPGSPFRQYRIQTVRNSIQDNDVVPFTAADEPFDEDFSPPYFGLYGVDQTGLLEHIADRRTYSEALSLIQKLAPGIEFPILPTTSPHSLTDYLRKC